VPPLLSLPFLTEPDPDRLGEGSLDPLGLGSIADHLADRVAPSVTARMSRVRFLTAIAVGAAIADHLGDEPAVDGKTPPYLAYEWIVVEALARRRPAAETQGVPGILKARRALNRSWSAHLDAGSYLQVPKVFGFHGVYKRLARAAGYVDEGLLLLRGGDGLVRLWEREQSLPGFVDLTAQTPGGRVARALVGEVRKALANASVMTGTGSHLWSKLAGGLGPDDPGRRERRLLWDALVDEREPIRRELVLALRDLGSREGEAEALRAVARAVSRDLRFRITAIETYEHVARLLTGVFQAMRVASTGQGTRPVSGRQLADNEFVLRASTELPTAMAKAREWLDPLGEGAAFDATLGRFAEPLRPVEVVDAVLEHHEAIQGAKGGKRPWLERAGKGFYVRDAFRTSDDPPGENSYIHPYRVTALSSFIADLGGGR
jgi:hypothetical protein